MRKCTEIKENVFLKNSKYCLMFITNSFNCVYIFNKYEFDSKYIELVEGVWKIENIQTILLF